MPSLTELMQGLRGITPQPVRQATTSLMDLLNERAAQPAFGMDPKANRLSLLPRYSQSEGMVAPDVLYSLAQALSAPGMAARGQEQGPMAGMNVALNAMGVGGAQPNMGGLGANAGLKSTGSNVIPLQKALSYADPNVPLNKMRMEERGYLDKLKRDISENGIRKPIIIENGKIQDGMHRLAVAQELGIQNIPVEFK